MSFGFKPVRACILLNYLKERNVSKNKYNLVGFLLFDLNILFLLLLIKLCMSDILIKLCMSDILIKLVVFE